MTDHKDQIVGSLMRRHSTAAVLLHHAIAERLRLGPSDLNCLQLIRERGTASASELCSITGLTSGAITGIVARLERVGFLRREAHLSDGRKQVLIPEMERGEDIHRVFEPIRCDLAELLESFDSAQLSAIARFLDESAALIYRHMARLRADALAGTLNDIRQRQDGPGKGEAESK